MEEGESFSHCVSNDGVGTYVCVCACGMRYLLSHTDIVCVG